MNKKLGSLFGFAALAIGATVGVAASNQTFEMSRADDTKETVIFANGEFNTELTGAITYAGDKKPSINQDGELVIGGWSTPRVVFGNPVDYAQFDKVVYTFTAGSGWANFGFISAFGDGGDVVGFYDSGASIATGEYEVNIDPDHYTVNAKSAWGTATTGEEVLNFSALKGISIKSSDDLRISSIVGINEAPAVEKVDIFANGEFNTELTGAITYAGDKKPSINQDGELVIGGWSTPRVVFGNLVDYAQFDKVVYTFTAGSGWANFGFISAFGDGGDVVGFYDSGASIATGEYVVNMDPAHYTVNAKSAWGTATTGEEVLDFSKLKGISIKSSDDLRISSIVGVKETPAEEEVDIFADGEFNTDLTGAISYAGDRKPSINEDGELVIGGWTTPRVIFTNKVDLAQFDKLVYTFAAGSSWANFGFINSFGEGSDVVGFYDAGGSLPDGEYTVNLDPEHYTVNSQSSWGTPTTGEEVLNFKAIKGISIKSTTDLKISSIVGFKGQSPEPSYEEDIPEGTEFDFYKDVTDESTVTIKGQTPTYLDRGDGKKYASIDFLNGSLMRQQLATSVNLSECFYQSGTLHFSLKNTDANKIMFRLFSGSGAGDMPAIQFEVANLQTDGQFHEYTVALTDLPTWSNFSSWTEAGQELDPAKSVIWNWRTVNGFGIEVYHKDGGENVATVGIDNVYVDFEAKTRKMVGIEVSQEPAKAKYNEGEKFAPRGLQIKAVFDDETKTTVMPMDIKAPKDGITSEDNIVKIRYTHGKDSYYFDYEAKVAKLESITILTNPTRTKYAAGEGLKLDGLVVEAFDGVDRTIIPNSDLVLSTMYAQDTAGKQTITVTYGGKTATFDIEVVKADAMSFDYLGDYCYNADGNALVKGDYKFGASTKESDATYTIANKETTINIANNWTSYRFSADFRVNVNAIYNETDGISTFRFTYKTTDLTRLKVGLGNVQSNYDIYFSTVTIALNNDGNEHTAVIRLADFDKAYDSMAFDPKHAPESGSLDMTKISSMEFLPVESDTGSITICNAGFAWLEDDLNIRIVDVYGPSVTLPDGTPVEKTVSYGTTAKSVEDSYKDLLEVYDGTDTPLGRTCEKVLTWDEGAVGSDGKLTGGEHTLTLSAKDTSGNMVDADKVITIKVTVTVNMTGITVDASNAKTKYTVGDKFSSEGLVVKGTMEDGSTVSIKLADCDISGYDMTKTGKQTVKVSYQTFTATYEITVNAAPSKGCGGSVIATSVLLSSIAIAGVALVLLKKKKEN